MGILTLINAYAPHYKDGTGDETLWFLISIASLVHCTVTINETFIPMHQMGVFAMSVQRVMLTDVRIFLTFLLLQVRALQHASVSLPTCCIALGPCRSHRPINNARSRRRCAHTGMQSVRRFVPSLSSCRVSQTLSLAPVQLGDAGGQSDIELAQSLSQSACPPSRLHAVHPFLPFPFHIALQRSDPCSPLAVPTPSARKCFC